MFTNEEIKLDIKSTKEKFKEFKEIFADIEFGGLERKIIDNDDLETIKNMHFLIFKLESKMIDKLKREITK